MTKDEMQFALGDEIVKTGGDYRFSGVIVSIFRKRDGPVRVVAENSDGLLFIFNPAQIALVKP